MQRDQLADFLRRRREAIRPSEVGLADGPRRRTTGLRREEVAMLAGMSVDYVVRLEQGRSSQPSTQLLGALARALRLSDDERDHLFHLAGHRPPPADGVARLARAGLMRMLDLLGDTPALVLSDLGEVLAQNRAAVLLTGDHTGFSGDWRYVVYRWFTDPDARAICPPEEQEYHRRGPRAAGTAARARHRGIPHEGDGHARTVKRPTTGHQATRSPGKSTLPVTPALDVTDPASGVAPSGLTDQARSGFASRVSAAATRACTPVSRVGWRTGAKRVL